MPSIMLGHAYSITNLGEKWNAFYKMTDIDHSNCESQILFQPVPFHFYIKQWDERNNHKYELITGKSGLKTTDTLIPTVPGWATR